MENIKASFIIQRANAGHTTNGNPRRVYTVFNLNGTIHSTHDEGYIGFAAVPAWIQDSGFILLPDVAVTPSEYRRLVKHA